MATTFSRCYILILVAFALFSSAFLLFWWDPLLVGRRTVIFRNITSNLISSNVSSKCSSSCSRDPFSQPGTLVLGEHFSDTRWIPFPPHHEGEKKTAAIAMNFTQIIPESALNLASPQYMKMLQGKEPMPETEWVRNKTILFIGSSHDRNNIQYFCDELQGDYSTIGGHTAGACKLLTYNLTMAFWFTYGSVDSDDYHWFAEFESRPLMFESKITQVMTPWGQKQGIGKPDLIIETSLFWDDNFFNQLARTHKLAQNQGLTYAELEWHRSRIHDLVTYTRKLFGQNIPLMFRTRHIRESNKYNRILRIFQLDQDLRKVAKDRDVKLFRWGDLLEGYTDFYDSDQHFKPGPADWLFGELVETISNLQQLPLGVGHALINNNDYCVQESIRLTSVCGLPVTPRLPDTRSFRCTIIG